MWTGLILVIIVLIIVLLLALVAIGLILLRPKETNTKIRCKYCGNIFDVPESSIVKYQYGGRVYLNVGCPCCGKYNDIQQ